MADIIQRTFIKLPTTDKAIPLANEEYLRKLNIGNNWNKIRIGIMCAVTPNGTTTISGTAFFVGICSADATTFANTLGYAAATTRNAIGADFAADGSVVANQGSLQYVANSGNPYYGGVSFNGIRRRTGTTVTGTSLASSIMVLTTNTGTVQRRSPLFVEITKGSPNYSITARGLTTASVGSDCSLAGFLDAMEQLTPTTVDGLAMTSAAQTLAMDETAGNLDTVNIYWNRTPYPMEIYALAVQRLS